jgi:hypothetical protein
MRDRSRAASSSTSRSTTRTPPRRIDAAARWVDRVGIASLLPASDVVLPSLWEQIAGSRAVDWGGYDEQAGKHVFSPEMSRCWAWKDALPARGMVCVGKHLGRWQALIAPRLVPALRAATSGTALSSLQSEIVEAVRSAGASTPGELRELVGADKKQVDAAVVSLQRAMILTNSHLVEQRQGWGAIAVELVERKWNVGTPPPEPELELARTVLASSGELSAADLAGALGWRQKRARETLERLDLHVRVEDGVPLYSSV